MEGTEALGLRVEEAAEEEEDGTPVQSLRQVLLADDQELLHSYVPGALLLNQDSPSPTSCQIIGIAEVDGKVLVAVPQSCWHRQANRRYLPRNALSKATLAEVAACLSEDRTSAHATHRVKTWVGLLLPQYEEYCVFSEVPEGAERCFVVAGSETEGLPYGPALTSIAGEHFAFVTATEAPTEEGPSVARLAALEASVSALKGGLDALLARLPPPERDPGPPPGLPRAAPSLLSYPGDGRPPASAAAGRAAQALPAPGLSAAGVQLQSPAPSGAQAAQQLFRSRVQAAQLHAGERLGIPGLDPEVVESALAAGVSEDQLRKMGALALKAPRL